MTTLSIVLLIALVAAAGVIAKQARNYKQTLKDAELLKTRAQNAEEALRNDKGLAAKYSKELGELRRNHEFELSKNKGYREHKKEASEIIEQLLSVLNSGHWHKNRRLTKKGDWPRKSELINRIEKLG